MKLIESKVENITQKKFDRESIFKQIELSGRVAYKSEDKITENSAEEFVNMLKRKGHYSPLEHGTVFFEVEKDSPEYAFFARNPYSIVNIVSHPSAIKAFVTTNYRVLVEAGKENSPIYYNQSQILSTPIFERISFRITCSIGVGRELTRHRAFSFTQESTRYCNYSKEKFGGLVFIEPYWYKDARKQFKDKFIETLDNCELQYLAGISGGLKPQDMREILPMCTKTEIIMTGFYGDWLGFLGQRLSKTAHPDMRKVAKMIYDSMAKEQKNIMEGVNNR